VINDRTSITTGTDKQTDAAVIAAAPLPTPATASAKNTTAAVAIAAVKRIANDRPP
jgi:hypothetical protein